MLALRLARGARPGATLRRLLVAGASAGVGFLLLAALGQASVPWLLWCAVPMAAVTHFAVVVARTDPYARPTAVQAAAGFGPVNVPVLAAVSTLVSCLAGSAVGLLFFLHLRGEIAGLPFDGAAAGLLGAGGPLPPAAALTLLVVPPVLAAGASAFGLRPVAAAPAPSGDRAAGLSAPGDLPWGAALVATGLAIGAYASRSGAGGGLGELSPAVLGSWGVIALGMVLAGPGMTYLAGRALCVLRPGALRLFAGRVLLEEARRIGRPLGALSAVGAGILVTLQAGGQGPRLGPIVVTGAGLVVGCAVATVLIAALETRGVRADTTAALRRLGTPAGVLRGAVALRAAALVAVFGPAVVLVAQLAVLPLR
ncbi:hypothetical protein SRB5_61490 [Streptomyces sp. RB5]|uniref:Uncharacterized protein n=1 Tax=Streptomyces smaragdinus TaxID=2585196 RepID=A0A7K0CR44_9ACTN|nr:hypothetical protein [Streptomyces smaragdinus]MQY15957.1 hypothetical protein [Streptomyces smaragdinus]